MELITKLKEKDNESTHAKYFISTNLRKIIKRADNYKKFIEELPDNLSTEFYQRLSQMMPFDG